MRKFVLALIASGFLSLAADNVVLADVPPAPEVNLSIQTDKSTYKGGEPILVTVKLENRSKETSYFGAMTPAAEIAVKRNGEVVPCTLFGGQSRLASFSIGPGMGVGGKSIAAYSDNLNRYFDLSMPGDYTAVVRKRRLVKSRDGDSVVKLESDEIKFSVLKDVAISSTFVRTLILDVTPRK